MDNTFCVGIFGWDSNTGRNISAIFGNGEGFGMGVKADCVIADVTIDADVAEFRDRYGLFNHNFIILAWILTDFEMNHEILRFFEKWNVQKIHFVRLVELVAMNMSKMLDKMRWNQK